MEIIEKRRAEYLNTFRWFIEQQRRKYGKGTSEVKFKISDVSFLYSGLYCIDFANYHDGHLVTCDMNVDHEDSFEQISCRFGDTRIIIESLNWGLTNLSHDAPAVSDEKVRRWFNYWFDPEDVRFDPETEFCGIIHQLAVEPGQVGVDFGTAPAEAIWDMLTLLRASGASVIIISSGDG